ncbi:MAG: TIGR01777 family oxidoreductase [Gemmatimonadaceae bacterium]
MSTTQETEPRAEGASAVAGGRGRVAVTGATGMVGTALVPALEKGGYTVVRVVRGKPDQRRGDVRWDPSTGLLDPSALDGVTAVVHLASENIGQRWSSAAKRRIRESRIKGTRLIATTIAHLDHPPRVFLSVSAVGFYGDTGDREVNEESPPGTDFLASVATEWEAATEPATGESVRVVITRFGPILSPNGGVLQKLLPPFRLGLGGRAGAGTQWVSWVALDDAVRAIVFAIRNDALRGTFNVVAPNPVTNAELAHTLGHVLHRPTVASVPASAFKLALGEMATVALLAGQRVSSAKLQAAGFEFLHPKLEEALRFELR